MLRLNVAAKLRLNEVARRLTAVMLRPNVEADRLSAELVHQRIADEVREKYRDQRHVNSRVTSAVWRRHRQSGQSSSGHRPNA